MSLKARANILQATLTPNIKKSVLELMTGQHRRNKIYAYQEALPFGKISEDVECYLVEEGKEEQEVMRLMR